MATKFGPKNYTHQFSARNLEIYRLYDGDFGALNFNTLSEFLREPRELPWQLNLNKNKPKLH